MNRCPKCDAQLVLAGHIKVDPPQYWRAIYRCAGLLNHEWTQEQLKEAFKAEPQPIEEQQSFLETS